MKIYILTIVLFICTFNLFAEDGEQHNYVPPLGYVLNEEVAISIAVAIWSPIYGKDKIENKAPFNASLEGDIWYVTGSLPENHAGGVPVIEIDKNTGQIYRVSHGL